MSAKDDHIEKMDGTLEQLQTQITLIQQQLLSDGVQSKPEGQISHIGAPTDGSSMQETVNRLASMRHELEEKFRLHKR